MASPSLVATFHRPLRMTVAGLWLVGVGFAGFTAPRAWQRTGVTSALPFVAVVFGLSLLAVAVLRANRVALLVSAIGLGAQILGVIGSAWELAQGVNSYKARELRDLGVDPKLGVALHRLYAAAASRVFAWLRARWFKNRSRFNP